MNKSNHQRPTEAPAPKSLTSMLIFIHKYNSDSVMMNNLWFIIVHLGNEEGINEREDEDEYEESSEEESNSRRIDLRFESSEMISGRENYKSEN